MLDEDGLKGMTSNPTIFEKAIAGSTDYDDQLKELAPTKKSVDEIYDALSMQDIKMAADAFRPLYDKSGGIHGYISYEVSPTLANDTDGTIAAARRYWAALATAQRADQSSFDARGSACDRAANFRRASTST